MVVESGLERLAELVSGILRSGVRTIPAGGLPVVETDWKRGSGHRKGSLIVLVGSIVVLVFVVKDVRRVQRVSHCVCEILVEYEVF